MTTVGLTASITGVAISNVTGPPAYQSVTYTAANSFNPGDGVTVTGISPSTLNITNKQISSRTSTSFTVVLSAGTLTGSYSSGGTATTSFFNETSLTDPNVPTHSLTDGIVDPIGLPPTVNTTYENTGSVYDIAVGGEPYYLAASNNYPYHRETASYQRQQLDLTQQPGEQTFEGWWLRSQGSWHLGAGINFLEPLQGQDVIYRFNKSVGIDPWTPGQLSLLNDVDKAYTIAGNVTMFGAIDGNNVSCAFVSDDSTLKRVVLTPETATITNVSASSGTVTYTATNTFAAGDTVSITGVNPAAYNLSNVTIATASGSQFTVTNSATGTYVSGGTATTTVGSATVTYGGSGSNISSMTQDGTNYYVANATGIYKGTLTGGSGTKIWDTGSTNVVIGWVKQRLIAGIGNSIYFLPSTNSGATTLPTSTTPASTAYICYTHPNPNWVWTAIAEGPTGIYASGYAGTASSIIKLTLNETSGLAPSLTNAVSAADFPDDEHVTSFGTYLGKFALIGTNKGIRVGTIDSSVYGGGYITYGPITYTTGNTTHVSSFAFRDRFAYATVSNSIDGKSGLIRIDLSQALSDGKYAYATDLNSGITGACRDVCFIGETGLAAFTVESNGLYVQSATRKVASGYIDTGAMRFNTMEKKHFKLVKMRPKLPMDAPIAISTITKNGAVNSIITLANDQQADQDISTNIHASQEQLAFRFTLYCSTTDVSIGAGMVGYQVKALPANKRTRSISIPLMCYDFESDRFNITTGYEGRAWERLSALENIEAQGDTVTIQDFTTGEQVEGLIEKITFDRKDSPDRRFKGFGGIIYVQVRTT